MTDEQRLIFLMQEIDSFFHVDKDRYDYAADVAEEHGRLEPTEEDELEGFRKMIDEAIAVYNRRG